MAFKKIKFADGIVTLELEEKPSAQREEQRVVTSREVPHPDFVEAFAAFVPVVIDLCELPEEYADGLTVRSASLSLDEEGNRGIVVTSLKKLSKVPAPLVLNTPHVSERETPNGDSTMPYDMLRAMDRLIAEARRYLDGKREQSDLFRESAPAKGGLFNDPTTTVKVDGKVVKSEAEFAAAVAPVIENVVKGARGKKSRDPHARGLEQLDKDLAAIGAR